MFKSIIFIFCFHYVYSYFTLPGKCPENVKLQENFQLAEFYGKWYLSYHYSSDGQLVNNCSINELIYKPSGIYLNQSRIDRGLFHRYSISKIGLLSDGLHLTATFNDENAPRRLKTKKYPIGLLATNYNYYATVYTCNYSPLTNKHFMYVWILSRNPILNDVSKELAVKPLQQIGVNATQLYKDDWSKCTPKYYEDKPVSATTFRYPVPL